MSRLNRVVLPELGGPTSATVRTAAGRGSSATAALPQPWQLLHSLTDPRSLPGFAIGLRLSADLQAARGVAAQGDFRTIHLEDARIAAGGAESRGDAGAGDEAKLHQAARIVGGQIDAVQDRGVAFSQVHQSSRAELSSWLCCHSVATWFQYAPSPKSLSRGRPRLPRFFLAMVSQDVSKCAKIKDNRMDEAICQSAASGSAIWTGSWKSKRPVSALTHTIATCLQNTPANAGACFWSQSGVLRCVAYSITALSASRTRNRAELVSVAVDPAFLGKGAAPP